MVLPVRRLPGGKQVLSFSVFHLPSRHATFRIGLTMAHFWFAGSRDESIETLQMDVKTGVSWLVSFFTSQVGTGSRSQCLALLLESIFLTSSSVTGRKEDSFVSVIRGVITGG